MLNQQRSGNLARLKYLVAVPICAALLCASTLAFSKTYGWVDLAPVNAEQITWASKGGKLPLPAVVVDGFPMLDRYLHKNIHYSSDKGEKGGLVVVGFSLDKDRKITGLKIVKSAGSKLDALALNGFRSYKGIVNDNSDKNYKLGVYFFTNDYSIFIDPYIKDPEFVGELIITNYNYVPSVTNKGYEYDEDIHGYGKKIIFATVTIYEKNKEAKVYQLNTATPDEIKLLKEKYGYIFPTASAGEDTQITVFRDEKRYEYVDVYLRVSSYLEAPYADDFYNYIFGHVKYPQKEKNDLVGGLVVLNFSIKNNGTIDNVSVSQSAGHNFDEAAINALQAYKGSIKDKAGQHSIAIVFCVVEKEIRPIVSEKIKKIGYVGEIAISELGRNTIQIDNK